MRRRAARHARALLCAVVVLSAGASAVRAGRLQRPAGAPAGRGSRSRSRGEAWERGARSARARRSARGAARSRASTRARSAPRAASRRWRCSSCSPREPERVAVGIEVHDALTEKRVLRDLDLQRGREPTRARSRSPPPPTSCCARAGPSSRWPTRRAPSRTPPPEVRAERCARRSCPARIGRARPRRRRARRVEQLRRRADAARRRRRTSRCGWRSGSASSSALGLRAGPDAGRRARRDRVARADAARST